MKKRMSKKAAKKLVSQMINCGMYHIGVADEKPERIQASLSEMIKADQKVHEINDAQPKNGPRTISMTIADRGIAAIYTAMSWEGGSPDEPNIVGYANGNYVLVISERHLNR